MANAVSYCAPVVVVPLAPVVGQRGRGCTRPRAVCVSGPVRFRKRTGSGNARFGTRDVRVLVRVTRVDVLVRRFVVAVVVVVG